MSAAAVQRKADADVCEGKQRTLNFLMGQFAGRKLLAPSQVAAILNRKLTYIYELIEAGELKVHAPLEREKQRYQVLVPSVEAHLARSAQYTDEDFFDLVRGVLDRLDREQATRAIRHLTQRLSRL